MYAVSQTPANSQEIASSGIRLKVTTKISHQRQSIQLSLGYGMSLRKGHSVELRIVNRAAFRIVEDRSSEQDEKRFNRCLGLAHSVRRQENTKDTNEQQCWYSWISKMHSTWSTDLFSFTIPILKFVNIISFNSHNSGRAQVYKELPEGFHAQSGVSWQCLLSPLLVNFVTDERMRRMLEGLQNPGVRMAPDNNFVDLEYRYNTVLLFEEEKKAQVFLDELTRIILSSGIYFAPRKCRVTLVDMSSLNTPLIIQGEVFKTVERFKHVESCIGHGSTMTDEVNSGICEARVTFSKLRTMMSKRYVP
ncbi:hypothetical protein CSKR_111365 [Clonorchis sinensis]|uniref:Uncharacterized protein n=1 Tax=Clonorchis sinensis TaxID=79923 RepID=A0A419PL39_CLOSI|nr:hypothetical protein CSKR_111365 [Clonorchis sinensis]